MPSETPEKLRPYVFHGVRLGVVRNDEAAGCCPFCDKDGKFSVNQGTGQWRCWSCQSGSDKGGGNLQLFLELLHTRSLASTTEEDYGQLARNRRLLSHDALQMWEFSKSFITGNWLVPGYNAECKMTSLYQYRPVDGKMRLLPTPTLGHRIHGANLYDSGKPVICLCEGPWDAVALWEVMGQTKHTDSGLKPTAQREGSLLAQVNVLAVPGAAVFNENWLPLFGGKQVMLMYDNDHPRKHEKTGHDIPPAGLQGMERVVKLLSGAPQKPIEVKYLRWGENGYNPELNHGHDVRDHLNA